MKKTKKNLVVRRETIRHIKNIDLESVRGGESENTCLPKLSVQTTDTCPTV
ncbi:MAG TPA: hypothetical protein VFT22_07445 [Kofleriaceae bacterium]|nr:hypothetical protein [Kofleriaceae bacterium]